jgi:hypothetical protein
MGVEYAVVCDKTKEAYELGRGPWAEWKVEGLPASLDATTLRLKTWVSGWPLPLGRRSGPSRRAQNLVYAERVAKEIWSFLETHEGCRVIDDCGDDFWHAERQEESVSELEAQGCRVYKLVGSRYARH